MLPVYFNFTYAYGFVARNCRRESLRNLLVSTTVFTVRMYTAAARKLPHERPAASKEESLRAAGRLSAEDARYVVYRLLADGLVTIDGVEELRRERREEVDALKTVVAQFSDGAPERGRRPRKKETRPRQLSPEVRERRRMHGKFVGLLRTIPAAERDDFRRLYKERSVDVAISALEEYRRELLRQEAEHHGRSTGVVDE